MSLFGLDREMGYTHTEFFKQAPRTLKDHNYRIEQSTIIVELPGGSVSIAVGPQQVRHITASMRLPYVAVSIRFEGVDEQEQKTFMRLFDTSYQKGGG